MRWRRVDADHRLVGIYRGAEVAATQGARAAHDSAGRVAALPWLARVHNVAADGSNHALLRLAADSHPERRILHCELARCCVDLHKAYFNGIALVSRGIRQRGYCSTTPSPASVVDAALPNMIPTPNVLPSSI